MNFENISAEEMVALALPYITNFIFAIVIFFIGKFIISKAVNIAKKIMTKTKIDDALVGFAGNILYALGMAFVVIAALSKLGVETTSLAAVIAAAGLAIGLALQGSLSNFASGVLIILFRPFTVGHYIEAAGVAGTVEEISIFTTQLKTPDNKVVIVPNGQITGGSITNYSKKPTRRVDMVVGVGYDDNLAQVKEVLEKIIASEDRILKDPAPVIAVSELADSSVNLVVRPWVNSADYWPVKFDLTEKVKTTFDKEGISIPYPQRDLHIIKSDDEQTQSIAA